MVDAVTARWHGDNYQARIFWENAFNLLLRIPAWSKSRMRRMVRKPLTMWSSNMTRRLCAPAPSASPPNTIRSNGTSRRAGGSAMRTLSTPISSGPDLLPPGTPAAGAPDGAGIGPFRVPDDLPRQGWRSAGGADCQTAPNRDPGSACKRDPSSALVQACPGSEQEGPARVAQCPHERRSGARGRLPVCPPGQAGAIQRFKRGA